MFYQIERIEYVHSKAFIHRDIKPENFLIGIGEKSAYLHIIDFGLAKKYKDFTGKHVEFSTNKGMTGTLRYASISSQEGNEQGRKDDLESLSYMIMYFYRGSLPWQKAVTLNKFENAEAILEMKKSIKIAEFCSGLPTPIASFMSYVQKLKFEEDPDYLFLRKQLSDAFLKYGFQYDYVFDWHSVKLVCE